MNKNKEISALDERIKKFRKKTRRNAAEVSEEERDYSSAGIGFQISTELLAGVLVGAAIGYFLDSLFHTQPWLLALFTIFGGAAGVLSIYKTFKAQNDTTRRK